MAMLSCARCRASASAAVASCDQLRRFGRPVSVSCSASWRSRPMSISLCRATEAWLATVCSSCTSLGGEAAHLADAVVDGDPRRRSGRRSAAGRGRASSALRAADSARRHRRSTRSRSGSGPSSRPGAPMLAAVRLVGSAAATARPSDARHAVSPARRTAGPRRSRRAAGRAPAQHRGQHVVGRGGDVELPAEAEQPLQAGVPVGERGVGAVADHQHRAGGDQWHSGERAQAQGQQRHQARARPPAAAMPTPETRLRSADSGGLPSYQRMIM